MQNTKTYSINTASIKGGIKLILKNSTWHIFQLREKRSKRELMCNETFSLLTTEAFKCIFKITKLKFQECRVRYMSHPHFDKCGHIVFYYQEYKELISTKFLNLRLIQRNYPIFLTIFNFITALVKCIIKEQLKFIKLYQKISCAQ